ALQTGGYCGSSPEWKSPCAQALCAIRHTYPRALSRTRPLLPAPQIPPPGTARPRSPPPPGASPRGAFHTPARFPPPPANPPVLAPPDFSTRGPEPAAPAAPLDRDPHCDRKGGGAPGVRRYSEG